jgi:hypothetical protein
MRNKRGAPLSVINGGQTLRSEQITDSYTILIVQDDYLASAGLLTGNAAIARTLVSVQHLRDGDIAVLRLTRGGGEYPTWHRLYVKRFQGWQSPETIVLTDDTAGKVILHQREFNVEGVVVATASLHPLWMLRDATTPTDAVLNVQKLWQVAATSQLHLPVATSEPAAKIGNTMRK